jgi:hypothetical protein
LKCPSPNRLRTATHVTHIAYVEHLTSALYLEKKSDVDKYLLAMDGLIIVSQAGRDTWNPHHDDQPVGGGTR